MNTNWENFLKNRGEWHGSFAQVAPSGEILESLPSILTIDVLDGDRAALFSLKRYGAGGYSEPPISESEQELRSIGRQNIFFDTGAFSKGTLQLAPFTEFITEFGFVNENRRLRFVQLFDAEHHFKRLVLIREGRAETNALERPPLTVEQLVGIWEGEAVQAYADLRNPETYMTRLTIQQIDADRVEQTLAWGDRTFSSIGKIGINKLYFSEDNRAREILLLPDGGSSQVPVQIQRGQPFFVEAGWLLGDRDRQRLIRNYNDKGEWVSSVHVVERKIDL
jgi:hypothetical protein